MDEDMTMEDETIPQNKPKIQTTLMPKKNNKSKVKLSKTEIRERMRFRMKKKVDELRKERNNAREKQTFEQMKHADTVDLTWFKEIINEPNIDNDNFNRLRLLRTNFTHPLARFEDGELKQEYYNDNKPNPSIYNWTDLELIQLYKGMEKYGFDDINSWMKISDHMVPTRNFADVKIKISQLLGIQCLKKYKGITGNSVNELWIQREYNKNKNNAIKNNAWKNGIYLNKEIIKDDVLSKEYVDKKIKEFSKKNKNFIEYRDGEFEDFDGTVYYFDQKQFIAPNDLYGYDKNKFDLISSDDDDDDDDNDNNYDDDNESDYSESMDWFNENNYIITDKNIADDKKEESLRLVD